MCQYVTFLGLLHEEHGLPNPLVNDWLILSVIRGIHYIFVTPVKSYFSITKDILLDI